MSTKSIDFFEYGIPLSYEDLFNRCCPLEPNWFDCIETMCIKIWENNVHANFMHYTLKQAVFFSSQY